MGRTTSSKPPLTPIFVDDRIGSVELAEPLRKRGLEVDVTRLDSADIAFAGEFVENDGITPAVATIGIERKRIDDLISSLSEQRYQGKQLRMMLESYTHCYLLIEGLFRMSWDGGIEKMITGDRWVPMVNKEYNYVRLHGFLNTLMEANVRVVQTPSQTATVIWLQELYHWWQKPYHTHSALDSVYVHINVSGSRKIPGGSVRYNNLSPHQQLIWRVMSAFPGVGNKAAEFATKFDSLLDLMSAPIASIQEVTGKGKRSREIYRLIRGTQWREDGVQYKDE